MSEVSTLSAPEFGASVSDSLSRIDELISRELFGTEEIIRDAMLLPLESESTRLRTVFAVLAAQFGTEPHTSQVTTAGAAVELMYLATLAHNEVANQSELASAKLSDTQRWKNNVAILVGDYRFAVVSRLGAELGPRAFAVIADTFAELVAGQLRATRGPANDVDLFDHYLRCVRETSGCVVAAAGQLGAIFSGAGDEAVVHLSRLGRLVGSAFQISDDVAALSGSVDKIESLTGEAPGEDVRQPLTQRSLATRNYTATDVVALLQSKAGIVAAMESIRTYTEQARQEISCLPACEASHTLMAVVDSAVHGSFESAT